LSYTLSISKTNGIKGEVEVPSDKSITHRWIILASVANGKSVIKVKNIGRDNLATIRALQQLGVKTNLILDEDTFKLAQDEGLTQIIKSSDMHSILEITGDGISALSKSAAIINCSNSGTTARLLSGLLSGCDFSSKFAGDESLTKRPFKRIIEPLQQMGAKFSSDSLPFMLQGGKLKGIKYNSPIASAQVKSAILLAGLHTQEEVSVIEPMRTRDHTEHILSTLGCELIEESSIGKGWKVTLPANGRRKLNKCLDAVIPGDFSSAAFLIVAALIIPNSDIVINNVGFNPTRLGLWTILNRMNANLEVVGTQSVCGEEVACLRAKTSELTSTNVTAEEVVQAIDEIPILAAAAAVARGVTTILGISELRAKESDRVEAIFRVLSSRGIRVEVFEDNMKIYGQVEKQTKSAISINSLDHRIVMLEAILDLMYDKKCLIRDINSVETSFPNFIKCLQGLS
jgi:3-phosphoshikimate 1-carboxyvinyltransferase